MLLRYNDSSFSLKRNRISISNRYRADLHASRRISLNYQFGTVHTHSPTQAADRQKPHPNAVRGESSGPTLVEPVERKFQSVRIQCMRRIQRVKLNESVDRLAVSNRSEDHARRIHFLQLLKRSRGCVAGHVQSQRSVTTGKCCARKAIQTLAIHSGAELTK